MKSRSEFESEDQYRTYLSHYYSGFAMQALIQIKGGNWDEDQIASQASLYGYKLANKSVPEEYNY